MRINFGEVKCFEDYLRLLTEEILKEQARNRKDAEDMVTDISPILFKHILKCLMFGKNCESYEHWAQEVSTWLEGIQSIKLKNNKRIPYKDLVNWACDEWLDEGSYNNDLINVMYDEEAYNPIGYTELKNNYMEIVQSYKQLLKDISDGVYNKLVLKNWLDKWLNKHEILEAKGD